MTVTVEIQKNADKEWNKQLLSSELGTIYHTVEYAEYVKRRLDWEPSFIRFLSGNGDVVGQLLLFKFSRIAKRTKSGVGKLLAKVGKGVLPEYKWVYGPVILQKDYRDAVYQKLGETILQMKGRINGSVHPLDSEPNALDNMGFKKQNWGTFLIDLSLDEEKLWSLIDKRSARKNVERSKGRGVTVREINDNDLAVYFKLQSEIRSMLNLYKYQYEDVTEAWNFLKRVGFTGFLAYQDDRPLSGLLVSTFNGYLNEWGVGRSKYDADHKLYSQDLIKWHIIAWGHDNGCKYYDLTGVNPKPTDEKELGIFRYKQKWGGKLVYYTIYKSV